MQNGILSVKSNCKSGEFFNLSGEYSSDKFDVRLRTNIAALGPDPGSLTINAVGRLSASD